MSAGAAAGNKIRKLEFLLAEAKSQGATSVITCGARQSNHCRATAHLAARAGLGAVVLLRTQGSQDQSTGNAFLTPWCGADVRWITPEQYSRRGRLMEKVAEELRAKGKRPYIIAEGGSSGLGTLGYVAASEEIGHQLAAGIAGGQPFDELVCAVGSGGTAAGLVAGAAHYGIAKHVAAVAVCNDRIYFERRIGELVRSAQQTWHEPLSTPCSFEVTADHKGPGYGIASADQVEVLREVSQRFGLLLDPVYTGKAFHFIWQNAGQSERLRGKRVLFLHTGGLPGLLGAVDQLPPRQ